MDTQLIESEQQPKKNTGIERKYGTTVRIMDFYQLDSIKKLPVQLSQPFLKNQHTQNVQIIIQK